MAKSSIYVGQKFGEWEVINIDIGFHTEPNGHKRRLIRVRCSCGKEQDVINLHLHRQSTKCSKCVGASKRQIKIGERYDKLVVIDYITEVSSKRTKSLVKCRCDCGNELIIIPSSLKSNLTNNCGCSPIGSWTGIEEISGTFLYRIKRNAEVRGLNYNLSPEFLWNLYLKQQRKCALTGLPITFSKDTTKTGSASLDRIDNDKGYENNNVQWVHKDINKMRMEFTIKYFIQMCKLVTKYND